MRRFGIAGVFFIASCASVPALSPDSPLELDLGFGVMAHIAYVEEAGVPVLNVLMSASTPWGAMAVAVDGRPDVEAVLRLGSGAEVQGVDRSKGFPGWGGSVVWQSRVRFSFQGAEAGDPPRILHLRLYEWDGTFEIETADRLTRVVRRNLAIGERIHVDLEHDCIELDLKLTAEPSTLALIVDVGIPGFESQNLNEGDFRTTMRYEGGGESHGFVLQPGFGAWVGCLHHMSTQAILSFPGKVGDGEARSLEVRIRNSQLLLRIADR